MKHTLLINKEKISEIFFDWSSNHLTIKKKFAGDLCRRSELLFNFSSVKYFSTNKFIV